MDLFEGNLEFQIELGVNSVSSNPRNVAWRRNSSRSHLVDKVSGALILNKPMTRRYPCLLCEVYDKLSPPQVCGGTLRNVQRCTNVYVGEQATLSGVQRSLQEQRVYGGYLGIKKR